MASADAIPTGHGEPGNMAPRLQELEARLSDELKLRRYTERVLDKRQEELELKEAKLLHLSQTVQRLKRELHDARNQLDSTKIQLQARSTQLNEVRDQVFRLQPARSEITESEAKSLYQNLCKSIQRWVESRMSSLDSMGGARVGTMPGALQAYRLVALLRESARRCIDVDQSEEFHVFAIIMNYIALGLFSRSFYSPIDESNDNATQLWIDKIEEAMSGQRGLQQPRSFAPSELLLTWRRCGVLSKLAERYTDHYHDTSEVPGNP